MKTIKALVAILLTELIIIIPIVAGTYIWGMVAFTPDYNANGVNEVVGKFHNTTELTDSNGNTDIYYQFKSNDNEVWWLLTETEMGFVPNENAEYALTYYNNGTTRESKPCDCPSEWNCECEVYDDIFLGIATIQN